MLQIHLPVALTHVFKDFVKDAPHLDGFDPVSKRKVNTRSVPPVAKGMRSMTAPRAAALNDAAAKAAVAATKKYQDGRGQLFMPPVEVVDTWSLSVPREDEPRSSGDARHHGHGVTQETLQLILHRVCPDA